MNNNTRQPGMAGEETTQESETMQEQIQKDNENPGRRFGITDIWRIRRSVKSLRIHNRIPRL